MHIKSLILLCIKQFKKPASQLDCTAVLSYQRAKRALLLRIFSACLSSASVRLEFLKSGSVIVQSPLRLQLVRICIRCLARALKILACVVVLVRRHGQGWAQGSSHVLGPQELGLQAWLRLHRDWRERLRRSDHLAGTSLVQVRWRFTAKTKAAVLLIVRLRGVNRRRAVGNCGVLLLLVLLICRHLHVGGQRIAILV